MPENFASRWASVPDAGMETPVQKDLADRKILRVVILSCEKTCGCFSTIFPISPHKSLLRFDSGGAAPVYTWLSLKHLNHQIAILAAAWVLPVAFADFATVIMLSRTDFINFLTSSVYVSPNIFSPKPTGSF